MCVLSIISSVATSPEATRANGGAHRPRCDHLLWRLSTVDGGPYAGGTSRQRQSGFFSTCRIPLITRRPSTRGRPGLPKGKLLLDHHTCLVRQPEQLRQRRLSQQAVTYRKQGRPLPQLAARAPYPGKGLDLSGFKSKSTIAYDSPKI